MHPIPVYPKKNQPPTVRIHYLIYIYIYIVLVFRYERFEFFTSIMLNFSIDVYAKLHRLK